MESPILHCVPAGELKLAVWEWPGEAPTLLFAHATGFHGRMWDHIARRFPRSRALALEFRGHGRSTIPAPPIPWTLFAQDVLSVARHFGLRGVIGVGHSMGGHSLVSAAIHNPGIFSALVLVDPVIFPPRITTSRRPMPDTSRAGAADGRRRGRCSSASARALRLPPGSRKRCAITAITPCCRMATLSYWRARRPWRPRSTVSATLLEMTYTREFRW